MIHTEREIHPSGVSHQAPGYWYEIEPPSSLRLAPCICNNIIDSFNRPYPPRAEITHYWYNPQAILPKMPSQSDLVAAKQFVFIEDPEEGGQLRTQNRPATQEQRPNITNRVKETSLKAEVRLVSCVHGKMNDSEPTSASLVVIEYHLGCIGGKYRFDSLKTRLAFTGYGPEDHQNRPLITKYEPSIQLEPYASTEVDNIRKLKAEGRLGVTCAPADAGITLGKETEEKYKSMYSASFEAFREYLPDGTTEPYAIEWRFKSNDKTKMGMPEILRVALLLERKNSDKFKCTFTLKLRGDLLSAASDIFKKVFRRAKMMIQ